MSRLIPAMKYTLATVQNFWAQLRKFTRRKRSLFTAFPINIIIAVCFIFLILLINIPQLQGQELSPPECRFQRWKLSVDLNTTLPLIPLTKAPFPCCYGDNSCFDQQIWGEDGKKSDKNTLLTAINNSLQYLQTNEAQIAYQRYPVPGITRNRVIQSLQRFRQLLLTSNSASALNAAVAREFTFYQSKGSDNTGSVLFTAYYEPIYSASRLPTAEYRYPIYRLPPDFKSWQKPEPTRVQLEGIDGLQGQKGKLRGSELFWFRSRLEPYIIQIEGSARLQLTDGTQTTVGYAGNTAYNYKSLGRELVDDHKLALEGLTMPIILNYFHQHPQDLNIYIPRDPSFVFFEETYGTPAQGSIKEPLSAERSIATDKSIMPPGALALIHADFPFVGKGGKMKYRFVSRYVLDQDTGGAIKGAGRVDYFLGSGKIAGDRAGVTVGNGQLYYLLLK